MPNQILSLGALAGAPPRRNMPPEAVRELWAQNAQGMGQQVLPVNLWDLAVNNPVSQYLGEVIGKGAEKVSEYLPENWRQEAMLTLPLMLGMVRRRAVAPRPGVQKAEQILKGIDPAEEKMLFHSATADADASIRQNWLTPQVGPWVREVLAGATDDPDVAEELAAKSATVYMSDVPDWVRVKVARNIGKHVKDVTMDDIRKHGQLTMIQASKDAPIVRMNQEDPPGEYVHNLRGEKQRWWETPLYDYDTRREIPFGVERGDYFAVEDIEPTHTLTGADLIQFLQRNHPATLSDLAGRRKPHGQALPVTGASLPPLTQNVRRPLSEYTPKLYREMDPKSAAGLMGTAESIGGPGMIHAANVPELALGQGANRGVMVEFDSSGLEGQVNTRKPGWEPSWQKGAAEFEIHDASQPVLRDAVRSVTISAEALAGKAQKQARLLRDYRLTGWQARQNPDGSITYTRPKQ